MSLASDPLTKRRIAAILASDVVGFSRMMGSDESGTLAAIQALYADVMNPAFDRHGGRLFKVMGDGCLAEFASMQGALACGVEIQRSLAAAGSALKLRIGIHAGDVIAEDADLFGDTVNIAARLESMAAPGGICISRTVHDQAVGKLPISFRERGALALKNIERPVTAFDVVVESPAASASVRQRISFCRSDDGVRLAYAIAGEGPPILKAPNWINHLEYDWEAPFYRGFFRVLSDGRSLVRFDARGNGLSDWDVDRLDFESVVDDMEAVAKASNIDRFPVFGMSQGCAYAIAYAARFPHRVSKLVLHGGYANGERKRSHSDAERISAALLLMRHGLTTDNVSYRQLFTGQFFPDGPQSALDRLNEMQRASITVENAIRFREIISDLDVRPLLSSIRVPTLVTHSRGDQRVDYELGRQLAASIADARLVTLDSRNHILLETEPAFRDFAQAVGEFLAD